MRRIFLRLAPLLLAIALLLPLPAYGQGDGPVYVVQAGDTLSAIARRFGTSVDALIQQNGISDPSRIFPGTELIIPGFPGLSGTLSLQTVELGDTLAGLGYAYSLDEQALLKLNRIVRPDKLYAGEQLIVPDAADEQAQPAARRMLAARSGETPLEIAARGDQPYWSVSDTRPGALRLWVLPGSLYPAPGQGEPAATGLPEQVRSLSLSPDPLVQGRTTQVGIDAPGTARIEGELGGHTLSIFQDAEGQWIGLQGIHALAEPGLVDFRLQFFPSGSSVPSYDFQQPVLLVSGDYGFQTLNGVPPETVDPAVTTPEEAFIAELLAPATPDRLWQGPFELPSRYYTEEFISTFGTRRSYNSGSLMYYHTGVDFYGRDTPIYAAASGRVVFAGPLTVRGNATYIDHGWGVYSGYLHQSEMFVQEGDMVEQGQVIGKVGATGRVTGPHLHWEIWVGDVPVQPLEWVSPGFPLP